MSCMEVASEPVAEVSAGLGNVEYDETPLAVPWARPAGFGVTSAKGLEASLGGEPEDAVFAWIGAWLEFEISASGEIGDLPAANVGSAEKGAPTNGVCEGWVAEEGQCVEEVKEEGGGCGSHHSD